MNDDPWEIIKLCFRMELGIGEVLKTSFAREAFSSIGFSDLICEEATHETLVQVLDFRIRYG